jgi:UDP-glucose:(heptosyl)LPS alpha-1,3-glucosyltransferase
MAALPAAIQKRTHFFVIGEDDATRFKRQAKKEGIASRVTFLGGRHDVPHFLLAADLLLHPAYHENTGTVLLEAIASGLPVLTTDVCGYAHYVQEAGAGSVLTSPFQQDIMNKTLTTMLLSSARKAWQQDAIDFARKADIYRMPEHAVDCLEMIATKKEGLL